MKTIQTFFSIPSVKFIFNVCIITGLFLNIFYFYTYWQSEKNLKHEQNLLSTLNQENLELKNQQTYFNSDMYKEKYAKELNFKNRGEKVIDTSVVESSDSKITANYSPNSNTKAKSNLEKWFTCLFGIQSAPTSATNFEISCK